MLLYQHTPSPGAACYSTDHRAVRAARSVALRWRRSTHVASSVSGTLAQYLRSDAGIPCSTSSSPSRRASSKTLRASARASVHAVKLLLQSAPQSAAAPRKDGKLPLHLAALHASPTAVVRALLSALEAEYGFMSPN